MTPQREGQYKDALAELRDVAARPREHRGPRGSRRHAPARRCAPGSTDATSAFKRAQQDEFEDEILKPET